MIAIAGLMNCGRALKPLLAIEVMEIAVKTEKKPAKTADCGERWRRFGEDEGIIWLDIAN
jgi:hypothetical protein